MMLVLDWGIGGLPIYRELKRLGYSPGYLSDSGATPYGKLPPDELGARITQIVGAYGGVSRLVIACNAASTVIDKLRLPGVRVQGVLQFGIQLALESNAQRIGVIGGRRTIESGTIQTALEQAGRSVIASIAQPLSAHVEAGRIDGRSVEGDVDTVFSPMTDVDAILMACTHYPVLLPIFTKRLPAARYLDPSQRLLQEFEQNLTRPAATSYPCVRTTGNIATMRNSARQAFGIELPEIETLLLPCQLL